MSLMRSSRHRKPVLLIVGCGDVGLRVLRLLHGRWRVLALTSSADRVAELRAAGATPLVGNLDDAGSLARLGGLADAVLHLAPPPTVGQADGRTQRLVQALARRSKPQCLVYGSTSGVYGDAQGAWLDETRAVNPSTDRAWRRVDAERRIRWAGRALSLRACVLRIPGIYAADRVGGDPKERVLRGAPVLHAEDDVYTNHIHADDLARACVAALWRGLPQRVVNVCDDSTLTMGDHFDAVADHYSLPRPPRLSRAEAAQALSPMQMSFLSESRRLRNERLKRELRMSLRYPTVKAALRAGR
ncbi:MAG: NAD(P)-dependent oxidoreductase [Ideonella sp. MAG2]|nr:MAG: NAD(P)-dependent oxidoreductase [Ideonella sp. MAG2]